MFPNKCKTSVALAVALLSTSCATGPDGKPLSVEKSFKATFASDDPCSNNARNAGIAVGALGGAILAKATGNGNNKSLLMGAGLGALVGGLIGSDMDRRRCEISKVAKAHNLDIVMNDISFSSVTAPAVDTTAGSAATAPTSVSTATGKKPELAGMSLTVMDNGQQFASGSAKPSDATVKAFGDVADQYHALAPDKQEKSVQAAKARNLQMRILLIGHTDDTGSSALNADLSEGRAQAIAEIFSKHRFSKNQIFYQGAGEVFPVASNSTEEGRARNRRVEIVDLSDDAAFAAFLESRRPNVSLYRPAAEPAARTEVAANTTMAGTKTADTNKPETINATAKPRTVTVATPTKTSSSAKAPVVAASPAGTTKTNTAAATPTSVTKLASVPVPGLANLDLGGKPADGQFRTADIGKTEHSSSFSIISAAYAADESPVGSCANDRPRVSRGVKSLSTGKVFKTSEYLPGTATASWGGKVNGHMVGMSNVSVLRDGGQPTSRPDFYIWKNYVEGAKVSPDMKTNPEVNAYLGDKALLYRIFLAEGPVRCMDLVIPKGAAGTAPNSNIVYEHNSALYQADFSPTIIR